MTFRSEDLLHALTQAAKRVDLDPDGPEWLTVAKRQAIEIEERRLINVELMRERDLALDDRDHALDLAAQYARQTGVDLSTVDALRYAEQWRERLDGWGRTAQEQESRRLGNLGVMMQLKDLAAGKRMFAGTAVELANIVAKALSDVNSAQHGPKNVRELFVAPDVPRQAVPSRSNGQLEITEAMLGAGGGS